jgi:methylmalonyl-CoA mutase
MSDASLTYDFPPQTRADWEKRLLRELPAGQTPDSLRWQPVGEPATLGPYYTAADTEALPYLHTLPDTYPYVRGHKTAANQWMTLESLVADGDGHTAVDEGRTALAAGADGLDLRITAPDAFDFDYLTTTFDLTQTYVGFELPAATDIRRFGQRLTSALMARNQPTFGRRGHVLLDGPDPLTLPKPDSLDVLVDLGRPAPDFYTVTVDGAALADAGAAPTLQVGLIISQLTEVVIEQSNRGFEPEAVIGEMRCTLGLGTGYFHDIAAQRALRLLWANALPAFAVAPFHASKLKVCARPSRRILFTPDPDTNLLRLTTSAMAGVIGGCDSLVLPPFDITQPTGATAFGRRQSRNIALLLQHEARLAQAVDPAAGSYYLESLTDTIAHDAWEIFQQLEAEGGYRAACASGTVARLVAEQRQAQEQAEASGKQVRVGVNKYQQKMGA